MPKAKRAPLTAAERQKIYRARERQQKAAELRELVALAFTYGQRQPNAAPIPATRLLTTLKEIRATQARMKTSTRAKHLWDLFYGPQPATTPAATTDTENSQPTGETLADHDTTNGSKTE